MRAKLSQRDHLTMTASNEAQAQAYKSQFKVGQDLGLLSDVHNIMVVADPGGRRIGGGGNTLHCLMKVLNQELTYDLKAGGHRGVGEGSYSFDAAA
jgi:fucokinase